MKKSLLALALCASLTTTAQATEPFVGHYHSGGVDWAQNLMLMDNNRFCFALIAGSLDLITGGTWQAHKKGNISTIELTETRLKLPDLLLAATSSGRQAKIGKKRAMMFSAYELDSVLSAHQIRYAFSHSDTPPQAKNYAPLPDTDKMASYVVVPDNAQYVFIRTDSDSPVYRFHMGKNRNVALMPNSQARHDPFNLTLVYNHQTHFLGNTRSPTEWGQPEKVSSETQEQAWQQCQPKAIETVRQVTSSEPTLVEPDILPAH